MIILNANWKTLTALEWMNTYHMIFLCWVHMWFTLFNNKKKLNTNLSHEECKNKWLIVVSEELIGFNRYSRSLMDLDIN